MVSPRSDSGFGAGQAPGPRDGGEDVLSILSALEESTRRGDWRKAAELAAQLDHLRVPTEPEELGRYLDRLRKTLIAAKASRSHAIAFLRRVNAAAGFRRMQHSGAEGAERRNFVDSAEI
jgi:hypothetical protein